MHQAPSRQVTSPSVMRQWENSVAYAEIVRFLQAVNSSVVGTAIDTEMPYMKNIENVCRLLTMLNEKIDTFPPVTTESQRFGNKAFRSFLDWLSDHGAEIISDLLNQSNCPLSFDCCQLDEAVVELTTYFLESFGNSTRIDYGTGHELTFLAFLFCLFKLSYFDSSLKSELCGSALRILPVYLELVRKLQTIYKMEPAGSHGVWCLDDFQFIPFIWGSSQLIGHSTIVPSHIIDKLQYDKLSDSYLLFSCLKYIIMVKRGPFGEHSPTLSGVSNCPHWEKVNQGMLKMYKAEVLGKYPVIQHFLFGRLLPFTAADAATDADAAVPSSAPQGSDMK